MRVLPATSVAGLGTSHLLRHVAVAPEAALVIRPVSAQLEVLVNDLPAGLKLVEAVEAEVLHCTPGQPTLLDAVKDDVIPPQEEEHDTQDEEHVGRHKILR